MECRPAGQFFLDETTNDTVFEQEIVGRKSRGKSKANEKTNAIQRERKRFRHSETLPKKANTRFVVYLEHPSSPSPISRRSSRFLTQSDRICATSSPHNEENKMQRWVNEKYGRWQRHGHMDEQNAKKAEQRRRSPRVSDVFVRETYNVSFHVLINSRVITGKLIPQSLSSFNEANYERHKCKHLIVVYTSATRVQNPAVGQEKRRSDSLLSPRFVSISTQAMRWLSLLRVFVGKFEHSAYRCFASRLENLAVLKQLEKVHIEKFRTVFM